MKRPNDIAIIVSISICVCIIKCLNIQKHTKIHRYNFIECFVHIIITTIESVRIKMITKIWKKKTTNPVSRKNSPQRHMFSVQLAKRTLFWPSSIRKKQKFDISDVSVFYSDGFNSIYMIWMRAYWEIVCWLWLLPFNNAIVIMSNFQFKFKPIIYT